jgi:hypothetical protein
LGRAVLSKEQCNIRAEIAEPEETSIARQWLGKYIPMAMDIHASTKKLFEVVFTLQSISRLCNEDKHNSVRQKATSNGLHGA